MGNRDVLATAALTVWILYLFRLIGIVSKVVPHTLDSKYDILMPRKPKLPNFFLSYNKYRYHLAPSIFHPSIIGLFLIALFQSPHKKSQHIVHIVI